MQIEFGLLFEGIQTVCSARIHYLYVCFFFFFYCIITHGESEIPDCIYHFYTNGQGWVGRPPPMKKIRVAGVQIDRQVSLVPLGLPSSCFFFIQFIYSATEFHDSSSVGGHLSIPHRLHTVRRKTPPPPPPSPSSHLILYLRMHCRPTQWECNALGGPARLLVRSLHK